MMSPIELLFLIGFVLAVVFILAGLRNKGPGVRWCSKCKIETLHDGDGCCMNYRADCYDCGAPIHGPNAHAHTVWKVSDTQGRGPFHERSVCGRCRERYDANGYR